MLRALRCVLLCLPCQPGAAWAKPPADLLYPPDELRLGGGGGVYFLAEPGPLVVEVEKRDRNRRSTRTELRAILVGPDRTVLAEATIPDDGRKERALGPPQQVRLATQVGLKGVYALSVTVSNDRYGDNIVWGFRSNCRKYLIQTARGHRDERHQEPIVLANPDRPIDVCFRPRPSELALDISDLPRGSSEVQVVDGRGRVIQSLPVDRQGRASHTFPPGVHRDTLWCLRLPSGQATLNIDGLTRWNPTDLAPDMACWTPQAESHFPLLEHRWLLWPYSRTLHGPGGPGETRFDVYNNSNHEETVQLAVEGQPAPTLSVTRVRLRPRQSQEVVLRFEFPRGEPLRTLRLIATPASHPDFFTWSSLILRSDPPPSRQPLAMPLQLLPYRHENALFGYLPDYPTENQPYFDLKNRPLIRVGSGVGIGGQTFLSPESSASSAADDKVRPPDRSARGTMTSSKIAFDRDGDVYTLGRLEGRSALCWSRDGGRSFASCPLPGDGLAAAHDIEVFTGHNTPEGPPPILRFRHTASDPKLFWRRVHDLELIVGRKENGRLTFDEPILVSRNCIGLAAHSGIPSTIVSRGAKVHLVWGEATDPAQKVPGVPAFVATYDRHERRLSKPVLVAYGPPANDIHNTPSITIDSRGYLHVLGGTHGRPFPYSRSLKPDATDAGWTEPQLVGSGGQTYIGMVCGPDDTLHIAFRLWKTGEEPFPASHYAALAYQRKPAGGDWSPPKTLVVPPFSEYSVYYHRLTIDRRGRLFLSYDYWSTHWFYRTDQRGDRRALLLSPDGGATWKLAEGRDLLPP